MQSLGIKFLLLIHYFYSICYIPIAIKLILPHSFLRLLTFSTEYYSSMESEINILIFLLCPGLSFGTVNWTVYKSLILPSKHVSSYIVNSLISSDVWECFFLMGFDPMRRYFSHTWMSGFGNKMVVWEYLLLLMMLIHCL